MPSKIKNTKSKRKHRGGDALTNLKYSIYDMNTSANVKTLKNTSEYLKNAKDMVLNPASFGAQEATAKTRMMNSISKSVLGMINEYSSMNLSDISKKKIEALARESEKITREQYQAISEGKSVSKYSDLYDSRLRGAMKNA